MSGLARIFCHLHSDREASARCPRCRRMFCRECVTEHDYQLLCKSCMDGLRPAARRLQGLWDWPARALALGLGLTAVYLIFYFGGVILSLIPPEYHAGDYPWLR